MRVIAGSLGGRVFASPSGHRTHPMSEKARGAIFNALGDIGGLTVLDTYSGSGALGIEALSRGALSVLAIDSDKGATRTIRENASSLGITDKLHVIQQNVSSWSAANVDAQFDVIFADPPYDDLKREVVQKLVGHIKLKGIFVLSWPGSDTVPAFDATKMVAHKSLGDIQLAFYRKIS